MSGKLSCDFGFMGVITRVNTGLMDNLSQYVLMDCLLHRDLWHPGTDGMLNFLRDYPGSCRVIRFA